LVIDQKAVPSGQISIKHSQLSIISVVFFNVRWHDEMSDGATLKVGNNNGVDRG
jgi:hypothetical protein